MKLPRFDPAKMLVGGGAPQVPGALNQIVRGLEKNWMLGGPLGLIGIMPSTGTYRKLSGGTGTIDGNKLARSKVTPETTFGRGMPRQ